MIDPRELSAEEWALVVELLLREQSELPTEIHHTRTSSMREELRGRLVMVRGLLARLEGAVVS